jgi:hypothetical protein
MNTIAQPYKKNVYNKGTKTDIQIQFQMKEAYGMIQKRWLSQGKQAWNWKRKTIDDKRD